MKSRLSWLEIAGFTLVGAAGAYGIKRYIDRPLSTKMGVGDVAFVPSDAIFITDPIQQGTINLGALVVAGTIKVTVTALPDPRQPIVKRLSAGIVGQDFGLRVPVTFDDARIVKLERGGKAVGT